MRILITGSKGNVGSALMNHLKGDLFGVDIVQGVGDNYRVCDICDDIYSTVKYFRPDVIIHLAAMVSRVTCEIAPVLTIKTNVQGTANVVQACKDYDCKLIYFSTSEVYGNVNGLMDENRNDLQPNNIYGISKSWGEEIVKYSGVDYVIIRPFMMYGEYETKGAHRSAIVRFVNDLKEGKEICVHEDSGRSWLHMDDAVEIIQRLLDKQGLTINIGHPDYIPTDELAYMICDMIGADRDLIKLVRQPDRMTLHKHPVLKRQEQQTGYIPKINITEGLKRMI